MSPLPAILQIRDLSPGQLQNFGDGHVSKFFFVQQCYSRSPYLVAANHRTQAMCCPRNPCDGRYTNEADVCRVRRVGSVTSYSTPYVLINKLTLDERSMHKLRLGTKAVAVAIAKRTACRSRMLVTKICHLHSRKRPCASLRRDASSKCEHKPIGSHLFLAEGQATPDPRQSIGCCIRAQVNVSTTDLCAQHVCTGVHLVSSLEPRLSTRLAPEYTFLPACVLHAIAHRAETVASYTTCSRARH